MNLSSIIFTAHIAVATYVFFYIMNESKKRELNVSSILLLVFLFPPVALGRWATQGKDEERLSDTYLFWTAFSRVNVFFFGLVIIMMIVGDPLSLWAMLRHSVSGTSPEVRNMEDLVGKGVEAGLFVVGAGFSLLLTVVMVLSTAVLVAFSLWCL